VCCVGAMDKGWLELESDPGLFTLLLGDFGVRGVQVEEVYDLQKPIEGSVYGFIFLFKWIEERRSRRKITHEEESFVVDEHILSDMYFAQQVIPNSCATHALLSVLMNTVNVDLGATLAQLKHFTAGMNSEDKGFAIGNVPALARAHNSHARPEAPRRQEKQPAISSVRTMEAFHFVSYVPINGRLFELDGLKPYPIDHGPWGENEEWTEKFRRVISERLGMATGGGGEPYHDIRFNLMAVVPDREQLYENKLKTLKTNRQIVLDALQQMVKVTHSEATADAKGVVRTKSEPVLTRAVAAAAKAALAKHQAEKAAEHGDEDDDEKPSTCLDDEVDVDIDMPDVGGQTVLDCHSYAKSPLTEIKDEDCDVMDVDDDDASKDSSLSLDKLSVTPCKDQVKFDINVKIEDGGGVVTPTSVASTDITKPLSIQTRFTTAVSPIDSAQSAYMCSEDESTDTASEVGSLIHSPARSSVLSSHSSPETSLLLAKYGHTSARTDIRADIALDANNTIGREALLKVKADLNQPSTSTDVAGLDHSPLSVKTDLSRLVPPPVADVEAAEGAILNEKLSPRSAKSKFSCAHGFTPKDLLALLKTVENEIKNTEQNLRDEKDKKKKYKVDDCRRTHNYDQFVFTFLSMLAEQGHLAGLVEQNLLNKRRPSSSLLHKHSSSSHKPAAKKKSKPKKKR